MKRQCVLYMCNQTCWGYKRDSNGYAPPACFGMCEGKAQLITVSHHHLSYHRYVDCYVDLGHFLNLHKDIKSQYWFDNLARCYIRLSDLHAASGHPEVACDAKW